jgi:hypothetical protein
MARLIMAVIALATCLAPFAAAQEASEPAERAVVSASENAALQYWAIWSEYPPEHWHHLRLQMVHGLRNETEPDPNAELLSEVSALRHCDFGIDITRGYRSNLRHIDVMHDLTNLLLIDAEVLLQRDRPAKAAERVAAAVRLCEHQTQNALARSAFAAADRMELIAEFIRQHHEVWGERERFSINWALQRFDADDPLRSPDTVRRQAAFDQHGCSREIRSGVLDPASIRRRIQKHEAGVSNPTPSPAELAMADFWVELVATIVHTGDLDGDSDNEARRVLTHAVQHGRRAMMQLSDAWAGPTPEESEAEVYRQLDRHRYSEVTRAFMDSVAPLRPRSLETAELIATLRAWATGETDTLELPEPDPR